MFQGNLARAFIGGADVAEKSESIGGMSDISKHGENKCRQKNACGQASLLVRGPGAHIANFVVSVTAVARAAAGCMKNIGMGVTHGQEFPVADRPLRGPQWWPATGNMIGEERNSGVGAGVKAS